ncbi:MAG: 3-hydroxyacyl-CoA dehydrogenase family protein, partial [Candidatus Acidiferrales bacterium]
MNRIGRVAVIGAGSMGHGIAQLFAQAGFAVRITDARQDSLAAALRQVRENLKAFVKFGILSPSEAKAAISRIEPAETIRRAVQGAGFVTECVTEQMHIKQSVFEELDAHASANAILASNTSSLNLEKISAKVKHKSRLIVTHYFNPPHIIPVVEVIPTAHTNPIVTKKTCSLLSKMGKLPVRLKKAPPGFLVNRIQSAMMREALSLLDAGVACAEEIDCAVRGTIGFRLAAVGPLAIMDFGGLDVWEKVLRNVLPGLNNGIEPPEVLRRKVKKGHLGVKSGRGFYSWGGGSGASRSSAALRKRDEAYLHLLKLFYMQ